MSLQSNAPSSMAHETPLFTFNKSLPVHGLVTGHFQLHHLMSSVSDCQVLVSCKTGVKLLNTLTGKTSEVFYGDSNKSVDYDPITAMIVATPRDQVVIRSLDAPGKSKTVRLFDDDEVISRALFLPNRQAQTDLVAVGNRPECLAMDLQTMSKRTLFRGITNTNSIDFNCTLGMYALAQDEPAIELKDERERHLAGYLRGHTDSNFSCQFLSDFALATSGQDCTVRVWDLRFPAHSMHHFKHKSTVYTMHFVPKTGRLFVGERMARIHSYTFKEVVPLVSTFEFLGPTAGFAVSGSGEKVWVGVAQAGVIEADISEP